MVINKINKFLLITTFSCMLTVISKDAGITTQITREGHLNRLIKKSDKPVVAKLYSDTCPACVDFAPLFKALAKSHGDKAIFVEININEVPKVAEQHKIGSIPTTLIFKPKKLSEPDKIVGSGAGKINQIKKLIEKNTAIKREMPTEEKKEVTKPISTSEAGLKNISSKKELDKIVSSGKTVIIELSKKECVPCQMIKPVFIQLAQENPDAVFSILDKDDVPDLEEEHRQLIKGYPTFLIFKAGKLSEDETFTGASERGLPSRINNILGKQTGQVTVRMTEDEAIKQGMIKGTRSRRSQR